MTEVGVTARTDYFGSQHTQTVISVLFHRGRIIGPHKTGPARSGLVLVVGAEQRCSAADAAIRAGGLVVVVLAAECPLGPLAARNVILLLAELLAPLLITLVDLALAGHNLPLNLACEYNIRRSDASRQQEFSSTVAD